MGGKTKEKANLDFGAVVDVLRRQDSALDTDCLLVKLQVPAIQYLLCLFPNRDRAGGGGRGGGRYYQSNKILTLRYYYPLPTTGGEKGLGWTCDKHIQ